METKQEGYKKNCAQRTVKSCKLVNNEEALKECASKTITVKGIIR